MAIAITIISLSAMAILGYITHNLLGTVKELAKLLKSDNLQEYNMEEISPDNLIDIGQEEDRYQEIDNISDEVLSNVDTQKFYKGVFDGEMKTENFNG